MANAHTINLSYDSVWEHVATGSQKKWLQTGNCGTTPVCRSGCTVDIDRTHVSKTRPLSSYQLTHDKVMQAWTSDIHAAARQEPTGGPVFILYSTQSSSYIYRYTILIRDYYYIAIHT